LIRGAATHGDRVPLKRHPAENSKENGPRAADRELFIDI
jgi:hypothetical protein